MARPGDGCGFPSWSNLDRNLLHQLHQLPNSTHWGLEYGCRFWLYRRRFHPRNEMALITTM